VTDSEGYSGEKVPFAALSATPSAPPNPRPRTHAPAPNLRPCAAT
jgi:hypothetical protein